MRLSQQGKLALRIVVTPTLSGTGFFWPLQVAMNIYSYVVCGYTAEAEPPIPGITTAPLAACLLLAFFWPPSVCRMPAIARPG